MVDDDAWPPEQPTSFMPLLLVHRKGHRTAEEVTTMAELMHTSSIKEVAMVTGEQSAVVRVKSDIHEKFHKMLDTSRATISKEIEEILAPFESNSKSAFILIEGTPGIGKSALLKEIAYKWGDNKQLLKQYKLALLLCLRNPSLQQVTSVDELLQLFCKGDKNAMQIVSACVQYLLDNGGKTLMLVLDGYDEYPKDLAARG